VRRQLSGHAGALLFALPLSSDKTITVMDGSGVLADPVSINKEEPVRLAKLHVPVTVEHFDKSKLSKDGSLIRIQDVKLPCMSTCDQSRIVDDAFCFSQPVRSFWMARTFIMRRTCISRLIYLSLAEDDLKL